MLTFSEQATIATIRLHPAQKIENASNKNVNTVFLKG